MIRPVTCVCMLLAGASGLGLYQSKHRAQLLDREIMRTLHATSQTAERVAVLRAEWALLNEPERLAELSQQHLGLRTLSPNQFVAASELAARLPAVPSPDAAALPENDAEESDPAPVAVVQAPPRPLIQPARPAQPPTAPSVHVAARPPAPQRPAVERVSAERPAALAWQPPTPRVLAPVVPAYAVPMTALPSRGAPMVQRVALPAPSAYETRPAAAPPVGSSLGSALGGSRAALAPPVPYIPSSFPR